MKKLHKWIGVAAALFFAVPTMQAQPNDMYRFMGNFDHGIGREVIQSIDPSNPGYLVAGTAYVALPNNIPGVMVSAFKQNGGPIWSEIYPINNGFPGGNSIADAVSIAASAPMGVYGVLAYTDYTSPSQAVLFQIKLNGTPNGIVTPLGDLRATSVVYDPSTNAFIVLGQSPLNNGDLQMIVVDAVTGGIIFFDTYDSGGNFVDVPGRIALDPWTGGYIMVGTSINPSTRDQNVFIVRVAPGFALICSQTVGNPGVDEIGVDVTWDVNSAGVKTDVILANQKGSQYMPLLIEMDPTACPGVLSTTLLDPYKTPNNMATAITTDPTNYNLCICGVNYDATTNGFVTVLDNGFNPLSYERSGQPWMPGDEDLTDILFDVTNPLASIVTTGEHQLLNPWPGAPTPPGEFFVWLPMMDNMGKDACPDMPPIKAYKLCLPEFVYNFQFPYFTSVPVNVFDFAVPTLNLDQCSNPFRQPGESNTKPALSPVANVYPNPASNTVSILYNLVETDQPMLEVSNVLGEVVMKKTLSSTDKLTDINVSDLAPGVYVFRIHNGDVELANEKITIQR